MDHAADIRPAIIETSGNKVESRATALPNDRHPAGFVPGGNPEALRDIRQSGCPDTVPCGSGAKFTEAAFVSGLLLENEHEIPLIALLRGNPEE